MTDPTGPYRPAPPAPYPPPQYPAPQYSAPQYFPADDVEYVVVSPPLVPLPVPRAFDGPPAVFPATGRPRSATAAAVLAFAEAGLLALGTVLAAVLVAAGDGGAARSPAVLSTVAACAVAALSTLGALGLLRGTGHRLLTATGWAGLALVISLTAWAVAQLAADGSGGAAAGAVLAGLAAGALPVVRLVLLARAEVRAWAPAAAGTSPGRLVAVGGPAAALAVVAALVIGTSGSSVADLLTGDPYAAGTSGGEGYSGSSDWGRYYRGGAALPAPPPGSRLFDAAYDDDARDCAEGDMNSCDELYWNTPVGAFYEWFGSSCAGRVDHELSGGCVDELGAFVD
jgi:hypothetical protein